MSRTPAAPAAPVKKKSPKKAMSPGTAQLIAVGVVLAFIAAIVAVLVTTLNTPAADDALPEPDPSASAEVLRADSHALTSPADPEVTVVEFLDFQCPACAVAASAVAELKAEYGDRVAIVVRNFPLTSIHPHAVDAALAFEAAAAQGATVEMYEALFATQQQWSPATGSQAATFRQLADDLGLDLAEYDRVVADPATLERIARDRDDAVGLGLQGTPSFFVDGEPAAIASFDELRALVEAGLDQ
ncbi:DsbA family protein [Microcella sp.]|uniref:DsbA family protein n=1 Tax=Microcella sp. TaxID=1913979 RepID=UPI00391929C5